MSYKIGWFSTGRDKAARDLLTVVWNAIEARTIQAEIAFVFSSRARGEAEESDVFFDLVSEYGIDLVCFPSKNFEPEMRRKGRKVPEILNQWRRSYDREIMKRLDPYKADLNVLAGYMLITGDDMCRKYDMINLHPAAPGGPKGTWQEVIWQLIEARAEHTGVMIHLVTEVLDEGPPIAYCTFPIRGGIFDERWEDMERKFKDKSLSQIEREEGEDEPLFREIRRQGVIRELPLLVHTIKVFAEEKIRIREKKVFARGEVLEGGYDLTEAINRIGEAT